MMYGRIVPSEKLPESAAKYYGGHQEPGSATKRHTGSLAKCENKPRKFTTGEEGEARRVSRPGIPPAAEGWARGR
jgi:hypothetical protein